jgi:cytochrome c553
MHKTMVMLALAAIAVLAGCSNIARSRNLADPNVAATTLAAQVCSNCHGLDGNSTSPAFPRLAGQQADYIAAQLNNFRSHQRSDPPGYQYMWGVSRHLSDAQIAGLADYYARQSVRRAPVTTVDQQDMAKGRAIFENGVPEANVIACSACHGPTGQGMAVFPRLALQHADYLLKQLDVFQSTQGRPGTPMETIVHPLTGPDMAAVAIYLQAFPE